MRFRKIQPRRIDRPGALRGLATHPFRPLSVDPNHQSAAFSQFSRAFVRSDKFTRRCRRNVAHGHGLAHLECSHHCSAHTSRLNPFSSRRPLFTANLFCSPFPRAALGCQILRSSVALNTVQNNTRNDSTRGGVKLPKNRCQLPEELRIRTPTEMIFKLAGVRGREADHCESFNRSGT